MRGELDWIVMKALEKDRNRRYETANGFAADVAALPERRAGAGLPAVGGVPLPQVRPAEQDRVGHWPGWCCSSWCCSAAASAGRSAIGPRGSSSWRRSAARQAKVSGQLELILDEVARLEQAEKWHEALVSVRRAEPALAAGEAKPEIQDRARQALADLELVRRLDHIRDLRGTVWSHRMLDPYAVQAEEDYADVFQGAGIDVDTLSVAEAAKRINARDGIAAALLPAMDDWVAIRSKVKGESATRRLTDVLRIADPDPWRQRIRDALARKDWPAVVNLAKSSDLDRQPAATVGFLCAAIRAQSEADIENPGAEVKLGIQGFNLELDILRRAQKSFPSDYWINHRLGISLIWFGGVSAEEGIGYMRAAIAVRPESDDAVRNLGVGYFVLKQYEDAISDCRKAIDLAPNSSLNYFSLAIACLIG